MNTINELQSRKEQLLKELAKIDNKIKDNHVSSTNSLIREIKKRISLIKQQLPELKIAYDITNDTEDNYIDLELSFKYIEDKAADTDIYFKKLIIEDIESIDNLELLDKFIFQIPKLKSLLKLTKTFNTKVYYSFTKYYNLTLELEKWYYSNEDDSRKKVQATIDHINNDTCELSISIMLELNNYTVYNYKASDKNFDYSVEFEVSTEGYDSPSINRLYKTEFDEIKINDIQDIIKNFEKTVDKNDIMNKLEKLTKKGDTDE